MSKLNKLIKAAIWVAISSLLFVLGTNIWVVQSTKDLIYTVSSAPQNNVALVLGTSKRTVGGKPNRFFVERMNTAATLHSSAKVKHILVSGDNRTKYYNEPRDMLNALGDLNIPYEDVSLGLCWALGHWTQLSGVMRCLVNTRVTIVTQEFHCYRSLFIASYFDMDAIAVSADDGGPIGNTLALREVLARTMAVLDLYILQRKPKVPRRKR